jgi:hypothetical protein
VTTVVTLLYIETTAFSPLAKCVHTTAHMYRLQWHKLMYVYTIPSGRATHSGTLDDGESRGLANPNWPVLQTRVQRLHFQFLVQVLYRKLVLVQQVASIYEASTTAIAVVLLPVVGPRSTHSYRHTTISNTF